LLLRRFSGLVLAVTLIAITTARAQTGATETAQPPDAERYVVEGSALLWFPTVAMQMSSDAPGVAGTTVDAVRELGVANRAFTQLGVVARLGRRHKIRFQLYPISYRSSATLARPITFSGATYPSGGSVKTTMDWTAYRIGYEWDAIAKPTWYLGVVGELKQTDIRVRLTGSGADQTRRTQVPVPAIGPVARVYITPRLSVTGEITGMAVPDSADRHYGGHYIDGDLYATFTLRRHVAGQAGFRSLDLRHLGESDAANITLRGIYAGVIVRR
jgi:hypothetical protein